MENQNKAQIVLSIVVGFLVLYMIFDATWLLWFSASVGVLGLLFAKFAELISMLWMKLAQILGKINGSILLTIIFFLILTPIALLMKIVKGKDELKLKKPVDSNFSERNHTYVSADLRNVW